MSTRSEIGIQNEDGTIESIYCHWDGYPAHNGFILFVYYQTENKVRELIKNGDLSFLEKNITPKENTEHSFIKPQDDVCIYYHRDRGENWKNTKPKRAPNIKMWEKSIQDSWQEYMYLFKDGKWYFSEVENIKWQKLTSDILKLELRKLNWYDGLKLLEEFENKNTAQLLRPVDGDTTANN